MQKFFKGLNINTARDPYKIYSDVTNNFLIQKSVETGFGKLSKHGALVVQTGQFTGRAAGEKYVVKDDKTKDTMWWENNLNGMTPEDFQSLKVEVIAYLNDDKDLYVNNNSVGAHEEHNLNVRVISTHPSHILFSNYLFRDVVRPWDNNKDFTILHAPDLKVDPQKFNTKSSTIITTCFTNKMTIITGTLYSGEIKKSMFSVLNYLLPEKQVLPMHSGSNCTLTEKNVSVFFGLSGTGKTTLSTDAGRLLIGDDEHGLSDEGVFNFEGGCYAKTYKLTEKAEPAIYKASTRFGSLLENVIIDKNSGALDFFDNSLTDNGRSSYPLSFIEEIEPTARGNVPTEIFFLSADAFGVLPPVGLLTKEQAMFYFVLGYTAKLAGTEMGVKAPQATFSPCFGAPFMLRHPQEYAKLLGHYIDKHNINVWLINTGWTGGPYGVGERFPLHITRKIIRAIQSNELSNAEFVADDIFGLKIPTAINQVAASLLRPQKSWENQVAYVEKAQELALSFHTQMKKFGKFYTENAQGAPIFTGK